jgi:hypothetical protein
MTKNKTIKGWILIRIHLGKGHYKKYGIGTYVWFQEKMAKEEKRLWGNLDVKVIPVEIKLIKPK